MKTILIIIVSFFSSGLFAQSSEKAQIERTILNYVESFYEADTTKAYESIVKDLAKRGYFIKEGNVTETRMSFEQFIRMAKRWKNTQNITKESPKKITVFDILDKTASAKVEALWGIDYFHLAKLNGKWMIVHVLWQEYPAKSDKK